MQNKKENYSAINVKLLITSNTKKLIKILMNTELCSGNGIRRTEKKKHILIFVFCVEMNF